MPVFLPGWSRPHLGGGGQYSVAALLKETLDLALGVLYVKFGPRDVLSWPPLR
jgi:hypothetical protein